MKSLYALLAVVVLGACAALPAPHSARELDAGFQAHSMARAQAFNEWLDR